MIKTMTIEEFESLLDDFGSDINMWPEGRIEAAKQFSLTEEGSLLLASDLAIDDLMASARAVGPETATDGNVDAFLDRLMDIPVYHRQEEKVSEAAGVFGWLASIFDEGTDWLSPRALVSQAASFAAILGVGVVVGLTGTQAEYDEIDISESWYTASDAFELNEE